ncbi:hypothetical protein H8K90_11885 [Winogradskyella echinorum]|uniref:Por secretion system C-terminal sorting domain-containing protein n=1 Tax=Winogradskyella echinorum TaxID=538189 RepID=A0ABR6Y4B8_9FLAO|nr:hypothetical protein [Winogradskyella echinorum]MBC3847085.1 hypothetical protein [Winogradskyella echinorum]MBC5751433.1 hypothetical protein [Winogradskyella echinorum]
MKKNYFGFLFIGLLFSLNVSAQETFKVMFYNLLNYPLETAVANREDDLELILSGYQPDLFLVCEINNITGATNVLNITRNTISPNFEMATYVSNTSDDALGDQNDLQNLIYYDSSKFILEDEIIVPSYLRDFNIYKLKLNTIDQATNPIEFYVVVCHLKASSGTENAQKRFEMVLDLEAYLDTLPADAMVLLGGDLNVYTASEAAFQTLLSDSNVIELKDPANKVGSWHNNTNYVEVFTQSTRTQNGFGGSTGGFDDRFDFILTSANMISTADLTYVPDSYKVYGNNGLVSCYNSRINSSNCGNTSSEFSFDVRDALHNFSDHLPVTVSLETDATLLNIDTVETSLSFSLKQSVIQNNLTLYISAVKLFNSQLTIYNNLGQTVKTIALHSDYEQVFNVSGLDDGLYFIASADKNIKPLKFIISN